MIKKKEKEDCVRKMSGEKENQRERGRGMLVQRDEESERRDELQR